MSRPLFLLFQAASFETPLFPHGLIQLLGPALPGQRDYRIRPGELSLIGARALDQAGEAIGSKATGKLPAAAFSITPRLLIALPSSPPYRSALA